MRRKIILGLLALLTSAATGGLVRGQQTPSGAAPSQTSSAADTPPQMTVQPLHLVHQVMPLYPPEAIEKHIEGNVLFNAVISSQGSVRQLEFVGGPPELKDAAMDAVRQWQYRPMQINGRSLETRINIGVLFSLTKNNYKAVAASNYPVSIEIFASSKDVPHPTHVAPMRTGRPPISDTVEGIQMQTEEVFDAWDKGNQREFQKLLDGFAFENPTAWLTATFGSEKGSTLVRDYEVSFERFKRHMARVADDREKATALHVEYSTVPNPPAEAGQPNGPPSPLQPLKVENFRFYFSGQEVSNDWVFSFIYDVGAFRIVGGTHTFWNDNWRKKRDENIDSMVMVPASVK
jgi:TonB family protein